MKLPTKLAPILFSALLSAIMTAVVSGFVIVNTQGISNEFTNQWLTACAASWPVAFPTVLVIAPLMRKFVERITV